MEEFYNPIISYPTATTSCNGINGSSLMADDDDDIHHLQTEAISDIIKTQIFNHPLYPNLVSAYIDCQKVGAPATVASFLEEIRHGNHPTSSCFELGDDPQLDHFMESYCEVLHQYKNELSKPFDEATMFLSNIELELSNLCKGSFRRAPDSPSATNSASLGEEEKGGSEESFCTQQSKKEVKEMLLKKYSGYVSSLKKEFMKKRKKEKLPKDARMALFEWWNTHYKWPYPTEEEKAKLSEMTGLDQKQINNWFINQRKRHWEPPQNMRFPTTAHTFSPSDLYDNGEITGHLI